LWQGALRTPDDFQRIVDKMFEGIGEQKTKNMHVHFSKIQYGAKGEIRHLTFADTVYGPNFEPFAEVIVKNNLTPHILSESAGTQMLDAKTMQSIYNSLKN
ncbi:MAG: endonuclease IV, partial [Clostridia bacterium]|nr:endonuclease IV [Clostridia bacterium]